MFLSVFSIFSFETGLFSKALSIFAFNEICQARDFYIYKKETSRRGESWLYGMLALSQDEVDFPPLPQGYQVCVYAKIKEEQL